jgi:hypothetical protein
MSDRIRFAETTDQALADREQGREELCQQILATPADNRWKISPAIYSRLSPEQLRRVLANTVGGSALPMPTQQTDDGAQKTRDGVGKKSYVEPGRIQRTWRTMSVGLRSAIVGVSASVIAGLLALGTPTIIALLEPQRAMSRDASTWPPCPRLDRTIDACLYVVQDQLSWEDASTMLRLPVQTLLEFNKRLAATPVIRRGSVVLIWRKQLPLE